MNNKVKKETYSSSIEKKRKALGLENSYFLQNYNSIRESNIITSELSKIYKKNDDISNAVGNVEKEKLIKVRKIKNDKDLKNKTQTILYKKVSKTNYNDLFRKIKTTSDFYNYKSNNRERNIDDENSMKNISSVISTKNKMSYIKM